MTEIEQAVKVWYAMPSRCAIVPLAKLVTFLDKASAVTFKRMFPSWRVQLTNMVKAS